MNSFTNQKQTHRHRKQAYGYQRGNGEGGEGLIRTLELKYKHYIKQIINKDFLYSTRNYTQDLVIICRGKNWIKNCLSTYLNHFAGHMKITL